MKITTIGIDIAKDHLDIHVCPTGEAWRIVHTAEQFPALLARLTALTPERIILEATGGLEILLATQLAAAGLPVVVINPRQARDFAKATSQLAKTDQVDARALAHFGAALQPPVRPLPDEQTRAKLCSRAVGNWLTCWWRKRTGTRHWRANLNYKRCR